MATAATEQTRARYPDADGFVERDGVRVYWERYGAGAPAFLLLPTWEIVHSRCWKAQIPYLARHGTVVTFDPRGNGRSDRPRTEAEYARGEYAADAVAVLDAANVDRALVVAWCDLGESLILASEHPGRVAALVEIAPAVQVGDIPPEPVAYPFDAVLGTDEGWAKENRHYWLRDWCGYAEFFFGKCFIEPHSTKQIEDTVGWALETDAETLLLSFRGWNDKVLDRDAATEHCRRITCPGLVVHGTDDELVEARRGRAVAEHLGWGHLSIDGGGHAPQARDPVRLNLVLREAGRHAAGSTTPARARHWTRGRSRPKRALYISSPIGLGHAWRDVAIADELRKLHPDLEVDWLAQDPVTRVLEARGERIHPASAEMALESAHIASESTEHDLHVFQAIRRMDEILVANFMVFHDLVEAEPYDVWIADEGWEIDYFLHENPELKTAAYCWLTDFVGWLPMPDGGEHEAFLTADLNAEMIEHIARYPRIRDRAIFIGNPDDIVPDTFGPGLPPIRPWTEQHFDFSGYVTGTLPDVGDRAELRAQLGYAPDEKVCIATVGGSGVGGALLRHIVASFDVACRLVPELRMVIVAGPRIDPASIPSRDGLEVRPYVHELRRHLAACDLAIVQGGLGTTMELAATKRPFIAFPLGHHFEQQFHVRHRLERYRAGRSVDFATSSPEALGAAIAEEIGGEVDYRDVETDGAARAAALIAEVL
jgi:pimeloyl-ACP methyl ester carboxylesterase/predicted glycosyltransferase